MTSKEDGIAKRLRWIVENRAEGNARELARKANLASESHVSLILARGGENASATVLARVAEAGGVQLLWLVTGTGPRDLPNAPGEQTSSDRFESVLREKGWSLRAAGRRAGLLLGVRFPLLVATTRHSPSSPVIQELQSSRSF